MKIGIIITGIICDYYVDDIINHYKNCPYDKIISTWNYIDDNIITKLKDNSFLIVQSDFGNIHPSSANYQNFSTEKGIILAESLNITHVLRVRADMYCSNIVRLLEIYKNIYQENKMIFLLHFHNYAPGYLVDPVHFGSIFDTKKYIYHYQSSNDTRFSELFRQDMCYGTNDFNIINKDVIYSGDKLLNENIDFHFLKHKYINEKNWIQKLVQYNNDMGFYSF